MEKFRHTRDDAVCGNQFYSMIERVPPEKQLVVKLMVEAFINGMNAEQTISADKGELKTGN